MFPYIGVGKYLEREGFGVLRVKDCDFSSSKENLLG